MSKKTIEEAQFSWDWKERADMPKVFKAAKKIFDETGIFPNCYNVDTKQDSYGILLSVKKYDNKEEIRKRWQYLWIEEECSKEEFEEFKKEHGYE